MSAIVTIDPANGAVVERLAFMTPAQAEAKIAAAHEAARAWRERSIEERAAVLTAMGAKLREERDHLALLAVREMGKPVLQARAEVEKCAWCCEYFAQNAGAMLADLDAPSSASRSFVAFRPLGIVLAIMPWNYPYWQVIRAAAPALMAGNAMLLKHAPNTTRCGLEIERLFREAGAPDGLFGALLLGDEEIDRRIADPRISAVTLTGSERAGVAVASAAGAALKKCVLELGGSDAFIVLADADIEAAAKTAVFARFQNNGQSCIAAKRFIVVDAVHDAFVERFVALTAAQRVGDPADEATQIGPMARADLMEGLHAQVRETIEAGAVAALGGYPVDAPGYFYSPTILTGVRPGMRAFDEEVFGPVAAVVRARDAEHALELANASAYGLGCSLWTRDAALAQRLAARVEAGAVFVNGMVASDPRLPFGGVKRSGYGRELSAFGIHEFVNIQTVWIA
ncbi:MAG TPA: NAD-dependent succinate-semialdehyde dehydrogenase [Verrucomicrobiae bacterium]|nr:NAD-dependent succinate-semialdehyde dehydrogenase [Verrucomicrobiae bacterium]